LKLILFIYFFLKVAAKKMKLESRLEFLLEQNEKLREYQSYMSFMSLDIDTMQV